MSASKNITMDSMLRFLDKAGEDLGSYIVGQYDQGWVQAQAKERVLSAQGRFQELARIVRARSLRFAKSSIRTKGESVAMALEALVIPECPFSDKPADVSGRWHQPVVVEVEGKSYRETKKVEIGMADYELTIQNEGVSLWTFDYENRIGIGGFSTGERVDEDAEFLEWLNSVSPETFSSTEGMEWQMVKLKQSKIYLMCLPKISSLSAVIKKLRKFETALQNERLYLCIADPEEAQTLQDQGFGVITYPDATIYGFEQPREVERPDSRPSFGPLWASMPHGLPSPSCQV